MEPVTAEEAINAYVLENMGEITRERGLWMDVQLIGNLIGVKDIKQRIPGINIAVLTLNTLDNPVHRKWVENDAFNYGQGSIYIGALDISNVPNDSSFRMGMTKLTKFLLENPEGVANLNEELKAITALIDSDARETYELSPNEAEILFGTDLMRSFKNAPKFITVGFDNAEEIDSLKLKKWPVAKKNNTYYLAAMYPHALAVRLDVLLRHSVNYILTSHGFKPLKQVVVIPSTPVESGVTMEEAAHIPVGDRRSSSHDEVDIPDLVNGNEIIEKLVGYALSAQLHSTEGTSSAPALRSKPPVQMEPFPRSLYTIPMFPAALLYRLSGQRNITTHTIIRARRFMGERKFLQYITVVLKQNAVADSTIKIIGEEFEKWYNVQKKKIKQFALMQKLPFVGTHSGYLCDVPGVDKTLNDGQASVFLASILGKPPTNYSDLYNRVRMMGILPGERTSKKEVAIAALGRISDSLPHLKNLFDTTTIVEFIFS